MLKKYLPELLVVLLIIGLGFLWAQTNRLNAAKNQTKAVQLAFDYYKVGSTGRSPKRAATPYSAI